MPTHIDDLGSVEVSVNEGQLASLTQLNTQPGMSVGRFVYGVAETGSQQTGATGYTDDTVVLMEPIPCGASEVSVQSLRARANVHRCNKRIMGNSSMVGLTGHGKDALALARVSRERAGASP